MKKTAVIVLCSLSLLAGAGIASLAPILKGSKKPPGGELKPSLLRVSPTPHPTPYWKSDTWEIETKAVAISPGQIWSHPIWVNPEWRNARLVGKFIAQGGGGNDVYAYVTNRDGLTNLQNGHAARVWYQSGRVTVDTVNASLPGGLSYFVLSNRFSIFTNKAVTLNLKIEYERLVYPET